MDDKDQQVQAPENKVRKHKIVGTITNYFSEQLIQRDFHVKMLPYNGFEKTIEDEGIDLIFIDNDIYEIDHLWYAMDITAFLEYSRNRGIELIVIKNSDKKVEATFKDERVWTISHSYGSMLSEGKNLLTPILLNESLFNPFGCRKDKKIVFLHFGQGDENMGNTEFHQRNDCTSENFLMDSPKRENIHQLLETIKDACILYIHYEAHMDTTFLKYIEAAAVLRNTIVVYDPKFYGEVKSDRAIMPMEESAALSFMKAFINSRLFADKYSIPSARSVFLKNTLINRARLPDILDEGHLKKNRVNISVITSSNRRANLEEYIQQLNGQNGVNMEAILLTHGFILTPEEKAYYNSLSNFDLRIIEGSEKLSLGECLNRCLNEAKYEYVTKVDDDDFYTSNYLIDSWIALQYSGADVVGKNASFVYLEGQNLVMLRHGKNQYRFVDRVIGGSLFGKTSLFRTHKFGDLTKGEDSDFLARIKEKGCLVYAGHPYETCLFRAEDQSLHTWQVNELKLLSGSVVMSYGSPVDLISMEQPITINI